MNTKDFIFFLQENRLYSTTTD